MNALAANFEVAAFANAKVDVIEVDIKNVAGFFVAVMCADYACTAFFNDNFCAVASSIICVEEDKIIFTFARVENVTCAADKGIIALAARKS